MLTIFHVPSNLTTSKKKYKAERTTQTIKYLVDIQNILSNSIIYHLLQHQRLENEKIPKQLITMPEQPKLTKGTYLTQQKKCNNN